jgi:hypothetical protein
LNEIARTNRRKAALGTSVALRGSENLARLAEIHAHVFGGGISAVVSAVPGAGQTRSIDSDLGFAGI